MKEFLIIAIYDSGYEFDVYASDKKISKRKKAIFKKHYDEYYYRLKFDEYLKRYYGKRYRIIIAEDGYIEEV